MSHTYITASFTSEARADLKPGIVRCPLPESCFFSGDGGLSMSWYVPQSEADALEEKLKALGGVTVDVNCDLFAA